MKTKHPNYGKEIKCQMCERKYIYSRSARSTYEFCGSCMANRHRWQLKNFMIQHKGGKCQICGYNKCERGLDFHHIDPKQKNFGLGSKHNLSWERLKEEIDKCILVCRNCHSEIEYEIDMQLWGKDISEMNEKISEAMRMKLPTPNVKYTRDGWEQFHPFFKYGKGKNPPRT